MAIIAYPFDSQTISETDYGNLFGTAIASGVAGDPNTNDFKVAPSSGMVLSVQSVGSQSAAIIRGHACILTAATTVTIATAGASTNRVDAVVLRLNYSTNTIAPAVLTGASGSTTPPALTWSGTTYEIPLAYVTVAAGATSIDAPHIQDARAFTGTTVSSWTTAGRPLNRLALGYNLTTGTWEATADGTTWTQVATSGAALSSFAGVLPLAKGGTGGTTQTTALQGLGIYVQATDPGQAAGRIWIQTAS